MSDQIKALVESWNHVFDTFQISSQKLQKPDPIFFLRAVPKIFEKLDINVDSLNQNLCDAELGEQPLLPLQKITEAVNFLLFDMSASHPVTLYDFIAPTPSTTIIVLRLFLNFTIFTLGKKNKIEDEENKARETYGEIKYINEEIDQLNVQRDNTLQQTQRAKENIEKMEKKISELRVLNKEPETTVNDMKSEFDIIQEKKERLNSELDKKTKMRNSLIDKIKIIEDSILTENQQMEIHKDKECADQRYKDIEEKFKEVQSTLLRKEEDIKTFRSNAVYSNKLEKQLNDLEALYNKVKLMENSSKDSYEIEKQLKKVEDENSTLMNELVEIQFNNRQLQEETIKINSQISDEDKQCALLEKETQNCIKETTLMMREIENIKESTIGFHHETQQLNNSIDEITEFYDKQVENYTSKINKTFDRVKDAEKKYLQFTK